MFWRTKSNLIYLHFEKLKCKIPNFRALIFHKFLKDQTSAFANPHSLSAHLQVSNMKSLWILLLQLWMNLSKSNYIPAPKNYPICDQQPPQHSDFHIENHYGRFVARSKQKSQFQAEFCQSAEMEPLLIKDMDDYFTLRDIAGIEFNVKTI